MNKSESGWQVCVKQGRDGKGVCRMTMVKFGNDKFKYYSTGHYYKWSEARSKWERITRKQVCSLCLDAGSEQDLSTWVRSMVRVKGGK